ncbi:MAG TPA: alpha/beta fold hydrolase [Solirubrobacteraceae bacterium]
MELSEVPPVAGVTHRYVNAGGVTLHVAEAGEGPPLLLLHGWPQHWWCWRHLIPRLAPHYRILAPDLRGWGFSDAPPGDYAKATFAADIVALLDAEGLERVRVISHDWGAFVSFLLALEHPERIERLVALDIIPPWPAAARPHPGLLRILAYQVPLATPGLGPRVMTSSTRFVRTLIRVGSGKGARWTDEELDVYANVLREPARARATSACYRTFLTRELPGNRRRQNPVSLDVPTRLVMGGASVLGSLLAPQTVANLEVHEIEGAGHFLAEEAPEQVLDLALPFLAG